MRVLITGATGFVGRALTQTLYAKGHTVIAAVRNETRARALLGTDPELVDVFSDAALAQAMGRADAVVNLAGEGIVDKRWNASRKDSLVRSRVETTERLVSAMAEASSKPRCLVSASAIGIYGNRGDEELHESSTQGDDFLADLCQQWEKAADGAKPLGVRVAKIRIGIVLGSGGALQKMLPPFAMGLGGRLGNGKQWMSWIHLEDLVGLILAAIEDEAYEGPVNGVAPHAVTNRDFTRALGRALGRPTPFPVPGFGLKIALGGAASVLLGSQRVLSNAAEAHGYAFRFPTLEAALKDILSDRGVIITKAAKGWKLEQTTVLDRPVEKVFEFFSRPENLGMLTPAWMKFELLDMPKQVTEGTLLNYRIGLGPIPMKWQSRIESWEPGARFVDLQLRGPYKRWHHEHRFEARGDQTVMTDTVHYEVPMGPFGRIAHWIGVSRSLRAIFRYRGEVVARRFKRKPPSHLRSVA